MRIDYIHFLIVVALASAVARAAEDRRPIEPEDILNIRWCGSLELAPDGKEVAYLVAEPAGAGGNHGAAKTNLWIASTDKSSPPRIVAQGHDDVRGPQWSPRGDRLAYVSRGPGPSGSQVWLMGKGDDADSPVTCAATGVADYRWSPDGEQVAFTSPEPVEHGDPNKVDRHAGRSRLWVLRLADHSTRAVTSLDSHVIDFAWSPTSDMLAATIAPSDDLNDTFEHTKLVTIDAATATIEKTLNENVADRDGIAWSQDGRSIAFMEFAPKHFAFRLAVIDARGGACRYPLDNYPGTPETGSANIHWMQDSRHLLVSTFEGTRCRLLRVDTADGSMERLAAAVQNFWSYSASADGRTIAIGAEDAHAPPNVVILRDSQRPVRLTDLNPQLSHFRLGKLKDIQWKNRRDGKTVFGVLITPDDFKAGQPRATVVVLHGGPQAMWWNGWHGTWLSWGQMLASRGYVVMLPNPRGSIGQGWRFSEAVHRNWGGMDFQDVMDGVDLLVDQGIADPQRLGIGGWSYGGFLTASATTQTDRFRAAIVGASWTDLETLGLTTDFSAWYRRMMGVDDEHEQRELYRRLSPLPDVDRCHTPTLVLHGEKDARCPLYHGQAWYRGLKQQGIEADMVVYPRAGHLLTERADQLDCMRRVLDWYDKHLRD